MTPPTISVYMMDLIEPWVIKETLNMSILTPRYTTGLWNQSIRHLKDEQDAKSTSLL